MSLWSVPTTWTSMGVLYNSVACLMVPVLSSLTLLYMTYHDRRRVLSTSPPCHSKEGSP